MVPCHWKRGDRCDVGEGRTGEVVDLVEQIDGDIVAVVHVGGGRHVATSVRQLELVPLPKEESHAG